VTLRVLGRDLELGVVHLFDHGHVLEEVDGAALFIVPRLELTVGAEGALGRGEDGLLGGLDQHGAVDAFLLGDDVEGRREVRGRVRIRGGLDLLRRHVGV
jgi:hypothetical protein